jgi:LemA protein
MTVVIVILVVVVLLVIFGIAQYNGLVKLRNKLQEAWRQVDVELNRRYDLVPNLVETVKGAAGYEASTLENIVGLRNQARQLAGSGATAADRSGVEGQLSQALTSVIATAEAYPDLRANASFTQLSGQLSGTEDRIANSRRYYNALVGQYNTKIESFPSMIFAGRMGFGKAGYFEVDDPSVRDNVAVDFSELRPGAMPTTPATPRVSFQPTPPVTGGATMSAPVSPSATQPTTDPGTGQRV